MGQIKKLYQDSGNVETIVSTEELAVYPITASTATYHPSAWGTLGSDRQVSEILSALNQGYQYIGLATPSTNPGTYTHKVFYIAGESGTYTNFGNIQVSGLTILKTSGNGWTADVVGISGGGSGSQTTISIVRDPLDGKLYWQVDGQWLLDPDGHRVPAELDANTSFKSFVFKRSNSALSAPTGGSYASPLPDPLDGWSDGIPSGDAQIWMSTRIFSSDGNSPQQNAWTTPQPISDTADIDFEFSAVDDNPGTPTTIPANWHNTATENDIWMAVRKCHNGVWGAWEITRIKGEKGEDGTSVNIKGTLSDSSQLPSTGNVVGDAYLIDGELWVWDGDSWENAGEIKGPQGDPGKSPYIHIKYSNDNGAHFTANNGETPGKYIGIYWDYTVADSLDVSDYTWSKWEGQDGFGYEYIFKLTNSSEAPLVPQTSLQQDDYVPDGWTDNPGDVSESNKFCWMCYRKKTDGVWGNWIGSSTNPGRAALFSHYGSTGPTGPAGRKGPAIRGPYEFDPTVERRYCSGDENAIEDGTEYDSEDILWIDVMFREVNGRKVYYYCTTTYETDGTRSWDNVSENWTEADEQFNFIATKLLLAEDAAIDFITGNALYLRDSNDNIVGGAQGADQNDGVIFWAGGDGITEVGHTGYGNFWVDKNGNLTAKSGTFAGYIRFPYTFVSSLTQTQDHLGYLADQRAYLVSDYTNATNLNISVGDPVKLILPTPTSSLNGFTYDIIVEPTLTRLDGSQMLRVSANGGSTIYCYAYSTSYNDTAFILSGGRYAITCMPRHGSNNSLSYTWAITQATGGLTLVTSGQYLSNVLGMSLDGEHYAVNKIVSYSETKPNLSNDDGTIYISRE